ncbi:DUF2735 domain-containing protein [Bradyrhizobium paxllaeri]|uniref:Glutamine synthetase n=2 Tax=Bradyrhizobium lablabi TaxID=722472 RepID=A0A0R3MH61_9BRAD|nr:DUF2735 domain-containing protein [Bradyrhizobium paxllaeri]KRR16294.1 glutamine synthetase [Bradyrhizobium lablabi]
MMTTGLNQGTAKIYQFPAGGRAALGGRRYGETKAVTEFAAAQPVNLADCCDSWYHAAAIQDASNERDH